MPWSILEFGEGWRERGEMNCENLGEGCERRNFPGDTNNIHCVNIHVDQLFETKYSAKRSDHD